MLRYETLILAPTEVTADELSMIESNFENLMSKSSGKVIAFDKWGKYRLSYPIKKNDYGIYILVRYEMPQEKTAAAFKELASFFKIKCHEIVMRHVTLKLDKSAPSLYKRPEPIDSNRTGNLDEFLKENKIESFLSSVDTSQKTEDHKETSTEKKEIENQNNNDETQEA